MMQMPEDRNRNSVLRQLAALQNMSTEELKEKWRDLYGSEPPDYRKPMLLRKLAYRIQELYYGGIPKAVKKQLTQIARNDPALCQKGKTSSKSNILPGTRFIRIWKGKHHEVTALEDGFEYKGRKFRSLSAVAKQITGTKWNGFIFFGVRKKQSQTAFDSR
jgi:hypothetical protein